ncbi:MAG: phage portal protein [Synergistaceae bacterium]|nr:phage portal protein [Synergistaceae bacterium]
MEQNRIARPRNSGYSEHGASRQKASMLKWTAYSKSPHEDISENLELLRERSRDLYAGGAPLGRGAIDRVCLNALGTGLTLNVRVDPAKLGMDEEQCAEWASVMEAEFDYWASSRNADFGRELTFYELQTLALKSILLDGEVIAILRSRKVPGFPYTLCVQLVESERLQTPPSRMGALMDEGVELNADGNVCAYWIANRNPNAELIGQRPVEYKRIPASEAVLHLFMRERIGQHRGVPFLAPVIETLKQLTRYTDAELMAAVVSGMYSIFFEHALREDGTYTDDEYASEEGYGETPGLEGLSTEMMYGSVMDLPEGVKATSVSPGRPNQNFALFIESLAHQIGGALGIPQELLFLHFTASYSASRGALLEAWKMFKYWRRWFAENFCQRVYEAFLDEAVSLGRVDAPLYMKDDYHAKLYSWAEWVGPSQGQLDPTKEVAASVARIENNLSTYQRECGELTGEDWDLVMSTLTREREKLPKNDADNDNGEAENA